MSRFSTVESARRFKETLGDKYNVVTVTQVAITLALAVLNWTAIRWWANVNLSQSESWINFPTAYLGLGLIFFWAFVLAYLGSYLMPVRVMITPLDINAITWAIYVYYSWNSVPSSLFDAYYFLFFQVLVSGFAFLIVGVIQNVLYQKTIGIVGDSDDLTMSVLESPLPREKIANSLWLSARRVLDLYHRKDLVDGTAAFYGREGEIEYYIGIKPRLDEKKNETGCHLTVLAYVRARHAIWKSYPCEIFHETLCNSLKEVYLKGCNVTDSTKVNFSQELVNEALAITGGWGEKLYEAGGGFYRPLLLIVMTAIATSYAYLNNLIDRNTAVFIFVAIVLTQVAPSIYSRRKKIK